MYENVTVIPADSLISVNGTPCWLAFSAPANVHAVQWHAGAGHVEYNDGTANIPLTIKEYVAEVAPFVALWETETARLKAEQAQREQEANRPPTLEEARNAKLIEINAGYSTVMEFIQAGYPLDEVLSWERQATQARELTQNPAAEAAFVRGLAATKKIPVEEMCSRILANAASWEPIAAMLTGCRQVMEEAAFSAKTVEEIQAIKVSYPV